jgi:predicted deacylase
LVEFVTAPGPTPIIVDHSDLFASQAGLFRCSVEIGDAVGADQEIGTVHGLDGSRLETLRVPRSGKVAILRRLASVRPNDRLLQIFWEREMA